MQAHRTRFIGDVRCPWCDTPHEITNFPIDERIGANGDDSFECNECGKRMYVSASWQIHYVVGKYKE